MLHSSSPELLPSDSFSYDEKSLDQQNLPVVVDDIVTVEVYGVLH